MIFLNPENTLKYIDLNQLLALFIYKCSAMNLRLHQQKKKTFKILIL